MKKCPREIKHEKAKLVGMLLPPLGQNKISTKHALELFNYSRISKNES